MFDLMSDDRPVSEVNDATYERKFDTVTFTIKPCDCSDSDEPHQHMGPGMIVPWPVFTDAVEEFQNQRKEPPHA